MSTFNGKTDHVEYHQVEIGEAGFETALVAPVDSREPRFFPTRSFSTWWWEAGPVNECFCCVSLPNGIALMSLNNLLGATLQFLAVKGLLDYQQLLREEKETYANECEGRQESNSGKCLKLLQWISQAEKTIRIHPSSISYLLIIGFTLIFFAFVGLRAMKTGDAKTAKLYMKLYPILFVHELVVLVITAFTNPSMWAPLVCTSSVRLFFITYYFKVAWSFYKRRAVTETKRLEASASLQGTSLTL